MGTVPVLTGEPAVTVLVLTVNLHETLRIAGSSLAGKNTSSCTAGRGDAVSGVLRPGRRPEQARRSNCRVERAYVSGR
jgi:hypothetical protein